MKAEAFIKGNGSIGVTANVQKDIDTWKVNGGAEGNIGVGLGGGVTALKGVSKCEMSANSKINATGKLSGSKKPPGLNSQVKLSWKPLVVEFNVSAFWDAWHKKESWQAIGEEEFYNNTIDVVPGLFGEAG